MTPLASESFSSCRQTCAKDSVLFALVAGDCKELSTTMLLGVGRQWIALHHCIQGQTTSECCFLSACDSQPTHLFEPCSKNRFGRWVVGLLVSAVISATLEALECLTDLMRHNRQNLQVAVKAWQRGYGVWQLRRRMNSTCKIATENHDTSRSSFVGMTIVGKSDPFQIFRFVQSHFHSHLRYSDRWLSSITSRLVR